MAQLQLLFVVAVLCSLQLWACRCSSSESPKSNSKSSESDGRQIAALLRTSNSNNGSGDTINDLLVESAPGSKKDDDKPEFYDAEADEELPRSASTEPMFLCERGQRLYSKTQRCDGQYQCGDFADETDCPGKCLGKTYEQLGVSIGGGQFAVEDCRADIPRWEFVEGEWTDDGEVVRKPRCRQFTWGGCATKLNMFLTKPECESECRERFSSLVRSNKPVNATSDA